MSYYIPPSSLLGDLDSDEINAMNRRFQNTPLRVGIIMESYDIDNQKNLSKNIPEYTVITKESNPSGGIEYKKYTNVISLDKFGGVADFFEYRLRPNLAVVDKESNKPSYDFAKQNGTLVLLLCLDGFSEQAIIIGGFPNILNEKTQRKTTLTKENALHMEGEYNGINWKVNKDGEFTLTFRSPTDNNGKVISDKYSGTFAKIDKTGSFEVKDKHNHVRMDNDKGGINTITDADHKTNANKNIEFTAKKDIIQKAEKWNLEVTGSATQKANSWNIEVSGATSLKTGSLKIESKTIDAKANQVNISANKVIIGKGAAPAIVSKTKFVGTGNNGAPVVSQAMGPFSTIVSIA